ncbi:MAG: hypothetical protein GY822_12805 [Deltaproteobacteria bacterium]|nr:hypothetical protein [Deltaproteobacteria bacterium]
MDISTRISASAALYAMDKGFDSIDRIPPKARPATIAHVAAEIGVPRSDVLKVLAEEWMETSGRSGAKVAGSELASQRSHTSDARQAGALSPMHVRMNAMTGASIPSSQTTSPAKSATSSNSRADDLKNLVAATLANGPSDFIKNATAELEASQTAPKKLSQNPNRVRSSESDINAGLKGEGKSRLNEEQPYTWGRSLHQKLEQFDAGFLQKGTSPGSYAGVDLRSIPDDDPRLDLPLYRGMNSMDPATHALALTGKLIPQGTSGDYEGFKLYSHKKPLDAYEFSADPYIAMKGAGVHGYLLQTTLRDLRDAGGPS